MFKKMNVFSKTSVELLSFLAMNPTRSMYEKEIAKEAGISVGATNQILRGFLELKLVKKERKGKMNFYTLNLENPAIRQFKIFINVFELNPLIDRLKTHAKRIILFGSCAQGVDAENSDIDLFFLSDDEGLIRAEIDKFKSKRKISPIITNASELARMKNEDKPLYERIMGGIELWRRKDEY
jgi:predicted nucleotidyltransferase